MKYGLTFFLLLFVCSTMAQLQHHASTDRHSYELMSTAVVSDKKSVLPLGLTGDPQVTFRPKSPMLITLATSTTFKGENYWMSSMTTQSYNKGKLGTYYYWDVQNNLRESRTFLDIAGKNKRGLKLVFRRR